MRWRAFGLLGSKLLGISRTVFLAWLLVPDDFGLFTIELVPLDVLLSATDVGMLPALVQKRELEKIDCDVAWTVGIVRGLLIGLALVAAAPLAASLLGDIRATNIIRLIAVRPAISALASIRLAQLERELNFRALAAVDLVTAAATTILTLALAVRVGVWALPTGMIVGAFAGVLTSYWMAPYWPRLAFKRERAVALLQFGKWVLVSSVVAMLGEGILVATTTRLAGTAALGRYALAASIALAPAAMVGSLIGGVSFAAYARVVSDERQVARVFRSSIIAMTVLTVPGYAILIALAPTFVSHTLDARWAALSPVIRILAVAGLVGLVFDAITAMLRGVGRPQASTFLGLAYTAAITLTVWTLTAQFGIRGAAAARVIADIAAVAAAAFFARALLRATIRHLIVPGAVVSTSAMVGAIAARASLPFSPPATWMLLPCGIGLASSAITFVALDQLCGSSMLRDAAFVLPSRRGSA